MSGGRSAGQALAPSSTVLFQEIEGETVLYDTERGRYYSLDPIGTRIWQLLVEHGNVDAVVPVMLSEFDVDEATLHEHLVELLERLQAAGLIVSAAAS